MINLRSTLLCVALSIMVTAAFAGNHATFVSINYGGNIAGQPGEWLSIPVTVKNTGDTYWGSGYDIAICDQNGNVVSLQSVAGTAPGVTINRTFLLPLPYEEGQRSYQFIAVQQGVEFFNAWAWTSIRVVSGNWISWHGTSTVVGSPGQTVTVAVQVSNSGGTYWGSGYDIGVCDSSGTITGLQSVAGTPPASSPQVLTRYFTITLPSSTGRYIYPLFAVQQGIEYFGPNSAIAIWVR